MNAASTCSLTFDDGPDPVWTPRVLDCLRRHQAPSTFFVMADRARAHADLIERMQREGHDVELHCVRHVRHNELQEPALRADTEQGLRTLAVLGTRVRRWRPPWGVVTEVTQRIAGENQLEVVGWSIDTEDWRGESAAWMHDHIEDDLGAGAIVLMHDGIGPGARRAGCHETVELIPRLVATLADRGLTPVPLSENAE